MTNTTNFITPPDFVDDKQLTVLLIDVEPVDVETLAFLCSSHTESFNVYLYREELNNEEWLAQAKERADVIIINTTENKLSATKEEYASDPRAYCYGPKKLSKANRELRTVFDYFCK